jgi:aminoglycoside 2'-N-acetyltransferase I
LARVRLVRTAELSETELLHIRRLCEAAFQGPDPAPTASRPAFDEDDWAHALGGSHAIVLEGGTIVAHAAVVVRELEVDGVGLRSGYVEAVATALDLQGRGYGTAAMRVMYEHLLATYRLGALATSKHGFYERLGWERWEGPTFVRISGGLRHTPEEDHAIMVLRTPTTPALDLRAPISCEWRPGDLW